MTECYLYMYLTFYGYANDLINTAYPILQF